jgi:hypothetical protein
MSKEITFPGSAVDPWLEELTFKCIIKDGKVHVDVVDEHKKTFEAYDTAMWLDWAHRYAAGRFLKKKKKKA